MQVSPNASKLVPSKEQMKTAAKRGGALAGILAAAAAVIQFGLLMMQTVDYLKERVDTQRAAQAGRVIETRGVARGLELDLTAAARALERYRAGEPLRVHFWDPIARDDRHRLAASLRKDHWGRLENALMAADELKDARRQDGCLTAAATSRLDDLIKHISEGAKTLRHAASSGPPLGHRIEISSTSITRCGASVART